MDELQRLTKPTQLRDAVSRLSRAIELLERGDSGAAVAEATKAKQLSSRSAAVREVLGLALYGQGRWQEALTELKAYRRFSGRADQNHVIADCLRALGRPQEAVPLAEEELRAKVPERGEGRGGDRRGVSALADQGRFAEALAFLGGPRRETSVSEPYTLRLWYVRGDILARAGRRDEAAAEFRKIMRHDADRLRRGGAPRGAQLGLPRSASHRFRQ